MLWEEANHLRVLQTPCVPVFLSLPISPETFMICLSHCCSMTWCPSAAISLCSTWPCSGDIRAGYIPQPRLGQHLQHHHHISKARTPGSGKAENPDSLGTEGPQRFLGQSHLGMLRTPQSGAPIPPLGTQCLSDK